MLMKHGAMFEYTNESHVRPCSFSSIDRSLWDKMD